VIHSGQLWARAQYLVVESGGWERELRVGERAVCGRDGN
jgi:hypothetical protein